MQEVKVSEFEKEQCLHFGKVLNDFNTSTLTQIASKGKSGKEKISF